MSRAVRVGIPEPLRGYTRAPEVEAVGTSIDGLLDDLDRQFPGLRFRVVDEQGRLRPHIRVFVNRARARDLATEVTPEDDVQILQALSGG